MLIARPDPATSYTTVSVSPGAVDSPGGIVADGGDGATLRVVVGVRVVVVDGVGKFGSSGAGGGAITVSCCELFTITSAITSPMTTTTEIAASTHSHFRGPRPFGLGGSGGAPPGGYDRPYRSAALGS